MWAGALLPKLAGLGHAIEAVAPLPQHVRWDDLPLPQAGVRVRRYPVPYFDTDPFTNPDREFYATQDRHLYRLSAPLVQDDWAEVVLVGNETFLGSLLQFPRPADIPLIGVAHTIYWATSPARRPADFEPGGTLANLRACDRVVCVARHVEAALRDLGVQRTIAIPNAVDLARFRPRSPPAALAESLGIAKGSKVVSHVANLKPVKQAWRLLEAAPAIVAAHPDTVFLLLGEGPCEADLRARCSVHGLGERVRFLGWVANELLPEYYALSDAVAMPSLSEGAPYAYLEALACGCPVVASPIEAAREFLSGIPGAIVAQSHEPGDIADAVCHALDSAGNTRRRREIREAAVARFGLDEAAARFSALIETV